VRIHARDQDRPVGASSGNQRFHWLIVLILAALCSACGGGGGNSVIPPTVRSTDHYASPSGTSTADGSIGSPWDLQTALNQPSTVLAGDTIWLRAGTYGNGLSVFTSALNGTVAQPVVVRQYADERAIINGGISVQGSYTWYWGFEVTNLAIANRNIPDSGSTNPFPNGFDIYAPGSKFINLIVHDTAQAFGFWVAAPDAEINGCLIYNNGWQGPDRGHGHGIYTQNQTGTKTIADNIILQGFALGIQAYGTGATYVQNYVFSGNTIAHAGTLTTGGHHDYNLLVTGGQRPQNITLTNNYTYHKPSDNEGTSALDWIDPGVSQNLVAQNNYWIGGQPALQINNWNTATFTGNAIYSFAGTLLAAGHLFPSTYTWSGNKYYGNGVFSLNSQLFQSFASWQTASQLDTNTTFQAGRPTGIWSFVRPNKYETGRANVTIYNWDLASSVAIDPSSVLANGDKYLVRNAQDYFNTPVLSGTYTGGSLQIPMTNLTAAQPTGISPTRVQSSGPEFGTFILLKQ